MIIKDGDLNNKKSTYGKRFQHKNSEDNKFRRAMKRIVKDYSIFAFSILLVIAGYISYLSKYGETNEISTNEVADIGDATLVSSNELAVSDTSAIDDEETDNQNKVKDEEAKDEKESKEEEKKEKTNEREAKTTANDLTTEKKKNEDYFIVTKMERENMYSKQIESYQKIIENPNCSAIERESASERLDEINQINNSIMIIENLIKTKGFKECVVLVNSNSINVIVDKEELLQEDIAKIQNIVSRELSAKVENIHISNKY